ncbi:MAG: hypothetical protein RJB16_1001 [Bacteroidota bacterium]|jgi:hypothetical protein
MGEKITKNCKVIGTNDAFKNLQSQSDENFTLVNLADSVHEFIFQDQKYLFDIKGVIFTKENTIILTGFLSDDTQQVGKIAIELFN